MVRRFNEANIAGTTASTILPANATSDSLIGNTEDFRGLSNIFPSFKLTGLDPASTYAFTFYASRMGVTNNRETGYTVTGATSGFAALNPANNVDGTVTVTNIVPTAAGVITISVAPTSNNNDANHFTYLGAMRVQSSPTDAPVAFLSQPVDQIVHASEPVTFSASVSGSGPYTVQW